MKILIFDTETGGISPEQNDILQLSYQVIEVPSTSSGQAMLTTSFMPRVVKEVNHYFSWPEDEWRVTSGAIAVNGLTKEFLATKELSGRYAALEEFFDDMYCCTNLVAHNGDFDKKFIIAEARRQGYKIGPNEWKPMIDTMKTTVDLCCLPPHSGRSGFKWPKLIELAECLHIDTDDINLHDSSGDVELTKRCFLYLMEKKFYRL